MEEGLISRLLRREVKWNIEFLEGDNEMAHGSHSILIQMSRSYVLLDERA